MSTKKIEHLDEQTILGDNDLMFMSKSNGAGYDSKKVTLASIANYVRSTFGSTGGNNSGTGYEMIDTSDSNNYLWSYEVGSANGNNNTRLEKKVSKDCLVWLNYPQTIADNEVKIDNIPLKMEFFYGFRGSP